MHGKSKTKPESDIFVFNPELSVELNPILSVKSDFSAFYCIKVFGDLIHVTYRNYQPEKALHKR